MGEKDAVGLVVEERCVSWRAWSVLWGVFTLFRPQVCALMVKVQAQHTQP